jgi:predicted Rossmann-fold nucleotide-binding protein
VLANIEGYWDPLIQLFDHMVRHAFIRPGLDVRYHVMDDIDGVIPALTRLVAAEAREAGAEQPLPLEKL